MWVSAIKKASRMHVWGGYIPLYFHLRGVKWYECGSKCLLGFGSATERTTMCYPTECKALGRAQGCPARNFYTGVSAGGKEIL